ncbi:hypothetical protein AB0G02_34980 [Actinosynnema sp. NPDC023658]|uniref:hypothetical protein n=1 Tax=Actinosynnema sp. NPDC023658 TaxID=3155465 RepID=UPI0033D07073
MTVATYTLDQVSISSHCAYGSVKPSASAFVAAFQRAYVKANPKSLLPSPWNRAVYVSARATHRRGAGRPRRSAGRGPRW